MGARGSDAALEQSDVVLMQDKIEKQSIRTAKWYHGKDKGEVPVPVLGPDLIDQRRFDEIKKISLAQVEAAKKPVEPKPEEVKPAPQVEAKPAPKAEAKPAPAPAAGDGDEKKKKHTPEELAKAKEIARAYREKRLTQMAGQK